MTDTSSRHCGGDGNHAIDRRNFVGAKAFVDSADFGNEPTTTATYKHLLERLVQVRDELSTVTSIMVKLARSYLDVVDGASSSTWCKPLSVLFGYGELEVAVQQALAAYENHVLRARFPIWPSSATEATASGDVGGIQSRVSWTGTGGNDITGYADVSEWSGLIPSGIRCCHGCSSNDPVTTAATDILSLDPAVSCQALLKLQQGQLLSEPSPYEIRRPPFIIIRQHLQRIDENIGLYERRIQRDTKQLEALGRMWAISKQRSFPLRAFDLSYIVRNTVRDYV